MSWREKIYDKYQRTNRSKRERRKRRSAKPEHPNDEHQHKWKQSTGREYLHNDYPNNRVD